MRRLPLAMALFTFGLTAANAQEQPDDTFLVPTLDVSLGYNYVRANAPPDGCDCFSLNGGYLSAGFHIIDWLSVAGEITGEHSGSVSTLGQGLNLITYMAGPRLSLTGHRFVPYGQVLFGGAHGSDSYFPSGLTSSSSATSFALAGGGGIDINLTRRFAVRAINAEYLRTTFPNGTNSNWQNHLMIGAGVVIKLGTHTEGPRVAPITPAPKKFIFTCATSAATVAQGDKLQIIGHVKTDPEPMDVSYAWSSDGGTIDGSGKLASIDTTGTPAGKYHVTGHAYLVANPSATADCATAFTVTAKAIVNTMAVIAVPALSPEEIAKNDVIFHENVQDALFDYDSYVIRPDAQLAVEHAAVFLTQHPEIHVLIGGYSDERGSAEYNVALSENRANAARQALIAAGVDSDRLEIISYGKETQVCSADNEACWQQNRRAAFAMHR